MKKILICFDGTSNQPGDAEQEKNKDGLLEDDNITNILKLHLLAGGNIENSTAAIEGQHSLYYSGVGTRGSFLKKILRQAFALSSPKDIITEALTDLEQIYEFGDHLYVFGFSRGAAIARQFASIIAADGLDDKDGKAGVEPIIKMLGVWDTVASFGAPNLNSQNRPISDVLFEDCTIASVIEKAYHLLALDENRLAFRPTLMNYQTNVAEIWFPGCHSDIGGGFKLDGLSDITLKFMMKKAKIHGLQFLEVSAIPEENLHGRDQDGDLVDISRDDIEIKPDHNAKLHDHNDSWRIGFLRDVTLAARELVVLKNNFPSDIKPALHSTVIDRKKDNSDYNPYSIEDEAFKVIE